ncbi:xenobiotic compound DszA family monooxygenase [Ameyamaea chiangmaiensis NBRC 103196]|nr:xenobiotic compound DszA family monooxygenase [Ameyamaea chiangmaiensis NBRC 103196]
MVLGLSMRYLGYHAGAWRHPDANPAGTADFDHFSRLAIEAEDAGIDLLFLADGVAVRVNDTPAGAFAQSSQVADLEPLTLLSGLAAVTSRVGLIATASTTYNEPYHVARTYASLDRISNGRAGWNVVTSWSDAEARNFGREHTLDYETRYERAQEFVDVVRGLWRSWEPGALVHDKSAGRFLDPARLHALNHVGPHFTVRGPLSVPPSPQGRPVIVQAGASPAGIELAARHADVIYTVPQDLDAAIAYRAALDAKLREVGRDPASVRVLPGIVPFTADTDALARAHYDELNALVPTELGLSYLRAQLGDLSGCELDGPVPEPTDPAVRSIARNLIDMARRDGLTLRQLSQVVAAGFGARVLVGSGRAIADDLQRWMESGAIDGFNLCLPLLPDSLTRFATHVLPELRARGLFRPITEPVTLRERLGLPALAYGQR